MNEDILNSIQENLKKGVILLEAILGRLGNMDDRLKVMEARSKNMDENLDGIEANTR